jgi:hypothetical protein
MVVNFGVAWKYTLHTDTHGFLALKFIRSDLKAHVVICHVHGLEIINFPK